MNSRSGFLAAGFLMLTLSCASGLGEGGPSPTVAAEWPKWDSVDALAQDADLVAIGVMGAFIDRWDVLHEDGTIAVSDIVREFRVEEVIKGTDVQAGATLPVGYSTMVAAENISPLNDHVLLFLDRFDWNGQHDGWVPLASDTGVFDIKRPDAVARGVIGPIAAITVRLQELRSMDPR